MPARDGTGPLGQGPVGAGGRGRPRGTGRGIGRGVGRGVAGAPVRGQGLGGSNVCECVKCGYTEPHVRGIPCTEKNCPKCGSPMRGVFCK